MVFHISKTGSTSVMAAGINHQAITYTGEIFSSTTEGVRVSFLLLPPLCAANDVLNSFDKDYTLNVLLHSQ